MLSRDKLEDIIKKGLVNDIFKMEQSYELMKTIGDNSKQFNGGALSELKTLFVTIQNSLQTEVILAAAKIYDKPSRKYQTRCLRGALQYLSDNALELPSIKESIQLAKYLRFMKAPEYLIKDALNQSTNFAQNFSNYIVNNLLKEPKRKVALKKLKTFRNKVIAHNEKVNTKIEIGGPTWRELKDLINISKNVVGVLGWSYFSTAYVIDGRYILSDDTLRPISALKRVFEILQNKST